MNPGKLNKRVQFIVKGQSVDEDGFPIEGEIVFKTVWASVRGLRGKEYYSANQVQSQDDKVINCRYFEGLTADMFVKHKDKTYNVTSINNLYERNEEYELHCREVNSSE